MEIAVFAAPDIDAVVRLEKRSFQHPWSRALFEQELACAHAIHLVAREGGNGDPRPVIAYFCSRLIKDELYILKLAVTESWRRRGVASRLVAEALRRAGVAAVTTVVLDVRRSNHSAIFLYSKHGFRIVGIRPKYYSDTGEDGLVMRKNLKEDL